MYRKSDLCPSTAVTLTVLLGRVDVKRGSIIAMVGCVAVALVVAAAAPETAQRQSRGRR